MGFNSAFKGLNIDVRKMHDTEIFLSRLKLNRRKNINASALTLCLITEGKKMP